MILSGATLPALLPHAWAHRAPSPAGDAAYDRRIISQPLDAYDLPDRVLLDVTQDLQVAHDRLRTADGNIDRRSVDGEDLAQAGLVLVLCLM